MKEKIEKLKEELKYVLDNKYTFIDYLEDVRMSKYTGLRKKQEAYEMLKYLEKEVK